jgi:hypothetical protein
MQKPAYDFYLYCILLYFLGCDEDLIKFKEQHLFKPMQCDACRVINVY